MIFYFLEKSINHISQKKRKQQNIFDDSLGFSSKHSANFKRLTHYFLEC